MQEEDAARDARAGHWRTDRPGAISDVVKVLDDWKGQHEQAA